MKINYYLFFLVLLVTSCKEEIVPIDDTSIAVFENTNVYFDMELKEKGLTPKDEIYRLDAGRVLLKKITLPNYQLQAKASIKVTLTSNGDPWDKSGSVFVIPSNSDLTLLDFESKKHSLKECLDSFPGVRAFTKGNEKYLPNIELMRFMTPFGVGHFNDNEKVQTLKPVYIPKWEKEVTWEQDITPLLSEMENEVYVGVFIDTWTKKGYNISVEINLEESNIPNHIKKEQKLIPVVNTIKYMSDQKFFDNFSRENLTVTIPLETSVKNARLYYLTTGHGGHEEGDEFTQKENSISLNNKVIKKFIPWRDDCASFRRFNPTSGVWTEKATWQGKEIEERIASSDYSRSNWCPGSSVTPEIIELGDLEKGEQKFEFSIPDAQAIEGDKINYWMVSAYLVYDN